MVVRRRSIRNATANSKKVYEEMFLGNGPDLDNMVISRAAQAFYNSCKARHIMMTRLITNQCLNIDIKIIYTWMSFAWMSFAQVRMHYRLLVQFFQKYSCTKSAYAHFSDLLFCNLSRSS